jgi:hypothetical protein
MRRGVSRRFQSRGPERAVRGDCRVHRSRFAISNANANANPLCLYWGRFTQRQVQNRKPNSWGNRERGRFSRFSRHSKWDNENKIPIRVSITV